MKRRIDISIEEYTLQQIKDRTDNVSAFLERCANEVMNGITKRYRCAGCSAVWWSVIRPQKCLACGKEALIELYPAQEKVD